MERYLSKVGTSAPHDLDTPQGLVDRLTTTKTLSRGQGFGWPHDAIILCYTTVGKYLLYTNLPLTLMLLQPQFNLFNLILCPNFGAYFSFIYSIFHNTLRKYFFI